MSNPSKQYALLLTTMFLWGASWSSTKVLVSIAQPMTIGFFRYFIAAVLFTALLRHQKKTPLDLFNRATFGSLIIAGATGIFAFIVLSIVGTDYSTAGQASIIAGLNPITVTVFAYLVHGEKLTRPWQYTGLVFAFSGVALVVGVQYFVEFNTEYLTGNVILVLAMVLWGAYSAASKSAVKTLSSIEAMAGSVYVGLALFTVGVVTEAPSVVSAMLDAAFWVNIVFLAVFSTFIGFTVFVDSIAKIGATRTGAFNSFVPVFGVVTSIIVLNESVYWSTGLGLILVVLGVLIVNLPTAHKTQPVVLHHPAERESRSSESLNS